MASESNTYLEYLKQQVDEYLSSKLFTLKRDVGDVKIFAQSYKIFSNEVIRVDYIDYNDYGHLDVSTVDQEKHQVFLTFGELENILIKET